ncbi:MAG TPA: hypothetical protein VGO68_14685 [Pyrinomonadaceae bacterium]|nr:hypothetical protein [Pyrinomonadaceae bacterium]
MHVGTLGRSSANSFGKTAKPLFIGSIPSASAIAQLAKSCCGTNMGEFGVYHVRTVEVVAIEAWPRNSCTTRMSTPLPNNSVATL